MKVSIECSSQEEFEDKIDDLVKGIKGEPIIRRSIFPAQNEMQDHFDKKFKRIIKEIKDEISDILKE